VSLLLTKDLPNQASATINAQLRDIVPMGSLGADKLSVSRHTEAQKLDNKRVAKGWKIQSLNNAVDSILASATRLENEIAKETKYWEQVLAVSDAGWSLCRLPNEKHTLGVRFGFAECMFLPPHFHGRC
jgi:mediator of RNA polymerase II transcription subunit 17